MRSIMLVVHRYVALVTAAVVIVLGLTGAALVFEGAMDRALYPQLWRVTPAGAALSLDTLAARAAGAASGKSIDLIDLPKAADIAYVAQAGLLQIFVNQYTGTVLGTRTIGEWSRTLPRRIHVLHTTLTSGRVGGAIVGGVTAAVLFLVLTGLWLWWPARLWRVQWSASWKRIAFDLHHVLGAAAAIALIAITASGVVMHYRAFGGLIARLDPAPPPAIPNQPASKPGVTPIGFDSLLAVARRALPGAAPTVVGAFQSGDEPDVAYLRYPEDRTPAGRSRVYVDRYSGAVLLKVSTRTAPPGTKIANLLRSIHTGDVYGRPTEALWLLAALVLVAQAVTGVTMWWNARGARRRRKERKGRLDALAE